MTFRVKFVQVIRGLDSYRRDFTAYARELILRDEGVFYLVGGALDPVYDFEQYVLTASDAMMPTVLESWAQSSESDRVRQETMQWESHDIYLAMTNAQLGEYRISYELIGDEMVPFSSRELHVEVVEPVLRLLGTPDGRWERVETAYQSALGEIAQGKAADAVTDAGTALQEAFTVLGCEGNALGGLINSARKKGILSSHDVSLAHWVSADRSVTGDAHNSTPAEIEDAWFTVHVVGALLLRLSKLSKRPQ